MKLSLEYLNSRHNYWKRRLGEVGIWNPSLFKDITIVIRPNCKSYNGLFIRKYLKINGRRQLIDRIFIYNRCEDFDTKFLDSILVHEMIHQYIIQNKMKDRGPHGPLFRSFMQRINRTFPSELQINITDQNPSESPQPTVIKNHTILLLHLHNGNSFCCIVNPSKVAYFEQLIRQNSEVWKVKDHQWAHSSDPFFNNYSRCTRSLHGIKKNSSEIQEFCRLHNILPIL